MQDLGFDGKESPLLDGTPRWLGKDSASNIAEVIGKDKVSTVSMTVAADTAHAQESGARLGLFVGTWCPSATSWVTQTLGSYSGTDIDKTKSFYGCSVQMQTLTVSDGALVIVSIDH